jgi:ribonuclease R
MLAANESVAKTEFFNQALGRPSLGVYRVHEFPLPTKVENFTKFIGSLGHPVKGDVKHITYRTIQDLLKQITYKNDMEENIIKSMAIRIMQKAFYSDQNLGHYGLALKFYTQYTSPIRRYPDLEVHRVIKDLVMNPNVDDKLYEKYANSLAEITRQCSDRELKAAEAERECVSMKMAEYMENYIKEHPDEEYNAVVTGVTSFGIFVQLPTMIEGMIALSSMEGYYTFNEETQSLSSKGKAPIQLGTELKVKCVSASKETQQVNFEIVKQLENKKNNKQNKEKKLVKEYGRN